VAPTRRYRPSDRGGVPDRAGNIYAVLALVRCPETSLRTSARDGNWPTHRTPGKRTLSHTGSAIVGLGPAVIAGLVAWMIAE
jgi:hypothetical protein